MDKNGHDDGAIRRESRPEASHNHAVFVRFVSFVLSLIRRPQGVSRDCGVGRAAFIRLHWWFGRISSSRAK